MMHMLRARPQKSFRKLSPKNFRRAAAYRFVLAGFIITAVSLGSVTWARAAAITQGYKAATALPKGAIVSLTKADGQEVEPATTENDALIVGIVVDGDQALLDVQPQGSQ